MFTLLTWLFLGLSEAEPAEPAPFGYLYQPAYCLCEKRLEPAEVYCPQPGDIIFFTDHHWLWELCFGLAGAGNPMHAGIVVRLPDGSLAALESGYNDTIWVENVPYCERLHGFKGVIWIRRVAVPLSDCESAKLTEFALAINKRLFAIPRLCCQVTPFRARGPWTSWIGKPHGLKRRSYFCSEAVLEGCVYAGLLDPANVRPAATYPRDMFFDWSTNRFLNEHFKLAPRWLPPQMWTPTP
jgi:hypothetical protein